MKNFKVKMLVREIRMLRNRTMQMGYIQSSNQSSSIEVIKSKQSILKNQLKEKVKDFLAKIDEMLTLKTFLKSRPTQPNAFSPTKRVSHTPVIQEEEHNLRRTNTSRLNKQQEM